MLTSNESLTASKLSVSVPGRTLVKDLDFSAQPGELLVILGRNGAGKTLTLHTLAGLRAAASGTVSLEQRDLNDWPRRELARNLALLPQDTEDLFPARVFDIALIGRHPHIGSLQLESAADRERAEQALRCMTLSDFADRDVANLSGGERRRLAIAQILCQEPRYYLLDEPVNHLDPQHQLQVLELFRKLADDGASVVATLHDINLAARFADRALLLHGDGDWLLGRTEEVLTTDHLGELFGVTMETATWRNASVFVATSR